MYMKKLFSINRYKKLNLNAGFTVVETLVAITVLAISVAGPLSISFQGLRSAQLAKDQTTASFLAQEGIEFIRARRDEDYINGGTPATDLVTTFAFCTSTNGCWIDMTDYTWGQCATVACNGATENPVQFNSANGWYGHSLTGVGSKYTRIIKMVGREIDGGAPVDEFLITSTVTWKTGPIDRSVVVQELITDWQENI